MPSRSGKFMQGRSWTMFLQQTGARWGVTKELRGLLLEQRNLVDIGE